MLMKCAFRGAVPRAAAAVVIVALAAGAGRAEDGPEYQRKAERLEQLRSEIDQIQSNLAADRRRQDKLQSELGELDSRIGRVAARTRQLNRRIEETRSRIEGLRRQRDQHQQRLSTHKDVLTRQILAAHTSGRQEYLRLVLNQEDPARLDRVLVYYEYLTRARAERIAGAVQQLRRLRVVEQSLNDELASLQALLDKRDAERDSLRAARNEREQVLARIDEAIAAKDQRLARLRADEQRLKSLVDQLQRALADIPEEALEREPFGQRKGRLDWPLAGELKARYGGNRGVGDMRWQGVVIGAPEGAEVHAVSHGRVVFSDWLRGVGMLIIIDHGGGYLTLYGHNQSLYKETGEWVQAGEVIATVGASGGQRGSGLYFEVRADGRPVDPMAWLGPRRSRS
ncbi:peptidoglycan DD-metalloendopeptidase family protein [Ectothiorhodospiraceae bacterium WFHF3C12]|nr:peptidoglycan DD-metalloendopeptidase family protein [Ectothiorhodospiraceae bacterium WFHF3C12]